MKVLGLKCSGCRAIGDRSFRFADRNGEPLDRVLVTGPPGSGKTSLLEVIIAAKEDVGAYMPRHMRPDIVDPTAAFATVEVEWWLHPAERPANGEAVVRTVSRFGEGAPVLPDHPAWLRRLFEGKSRENGQGTFEYFGARREVSRLQAATRPQAINEARWFLCDDPEKYALLGPWLASEISADNRRALREGRQHGMALFLGDDFEVSIREALRPVVAEKVFHGLRSMSDRGESVFMDRRETEYLVEQLSTSERHAVLLVLSILRRNLRQSVILIDEPEIHIHPKDHRALMTHAAALANGSQIIAATTSPGILSSGTPEEIISLGEGAR